MRVYRVTYKQSGGVLKTVASRGRGRVEALRFACRKYGINAQNVTLIQCKIQPA